MVDTYAARRRLHMAPEVWREPGELVPEAHTWWRLDSYLHAGYVEEKQAEEKDFRAAVEKYCPELAERIYELAGLDAHLDGPRKTPRTRKTAAAKPKAEPGVVVTLKDDAPAEE